jgi:PAS domain S-box-containing protein
MILMRIPPKILIIDDDLSICQIFERFLTTNDYEVSSSNNGQEALFLSRSKFFNVILLDIILPGLDGLSLLSKIKNFSPDTEVIMITGHWDIETAVRAFKLGAYDYLTKPIDLSLLSQVVRKALEKQTLEFEKRILIAEIEFKNRLLEEQKKGLEGRLVQDDYKISQLLNEELFRKRLFDKVIENLSLGTMVIDNEGKVIMFNKIQEIFSGLSRDSILGKNLFQDPLPTDLKPWQEMAKDVLSDKSCEVKVVDQRPEKNRILSITRSSLMDEKGSPESFIFLSADITNGKKVEEQMIQLEKMNAIGQLAADLAHQIRNPLGVISCASQHCIEKIGCGNGLNGLKKNLEIIHRNVQSANDIISDLLSFAKPKPLELKNNDINQLLRETCNLLKIDFLRNRIRIVRRFDRYLPAILCDKGSLEQVFLNLLMNSKQAMPKGGVISITTNYNLEKKMVNIVTKDTGTGIPKEHMSNIFTPYFTTKERGTGLGLSIAFRIISNHCGTILPESDEGKGTKISIALPIQPIDLGSSILGRENESNSDRR